MRLPGPRTPFGHLAGGLGILRNPYDLLWIYERYGPASTIGQGPVRFTYLLGPEANELILSSKREAFEWREAFKSLIPVNGDTALVVSDGAEHARRRKLVQPAFGLRRIEGYRPIIEEEAGAAVDRMLAAGEVDAYRELKGTIRRIAIRTLFGDALGAESERFGDQLQIAIDYANLPLLLQTQRDWPGFPFRRAMRATRALDDVIYAEIARRRAADSPGEDLLASLVTAADDRDALTDAEIRDQVVSLIAGGYETTSSLAAWATLEVLRHPEWIDRIRSGDDAYLGAVLHEVLRLSSPGPISIRYVPEGVSFAGYEVRPGSRVIWSPSITHRLPRFWRDPLRYDPERWLDGSTDDLPPHVYVPFGGGYRRCIGFAMATLEVKVLLAELFGRADVTLLDDDVKPAGLAAMYPKGGVQIRATARAARRTSSR